MKKICLLKITLAHAQVLFDFIDNNREYLSQYGETTVHRYPNFESVLYEINSPRNTKVTHLEIWLRNVLVGTLSITATTGDSCEIGYWVGHEFSQKGIATAATKQIIQSCRKDPIINKVIASARIDNLPSQQVLVKAGMTKTYQIADRVWFALDTSS